MCEEASRVHHGWNSYGGSAEVLYIGNRYTRYDIVYSLWKHRVAKRRSEGNRNIRGNPKIVDKLPTQSPSRGRHGGSVVNEEVQ